MLKMRKLFLLWSPQGAAREMGVMWWGWEAERSKVEYYEGT